MSADGRLAQSEPSSATRVSPLSIHSQDGGIVQVIEASE